MDRGKNNLRVTLKQTYTLCVSPMTHACEQQRQQEIGKSINPINCHCLHSYFYSMHRNKQWYIQLS